MLPGLHLFASIDQLCSVCGTKAASDHWASGIQARSGDSIMRKLVGLAFVAGALMVSACNTIEGAGKDVSSAGRTVAKTADDAK
jgi:predicted small secreted protein